jgi:hypothetical protein
MLKRIARDWRMKLLAQKVIGLLPERWAFPLNQLMIRAVLGDLSVRLDTIERAGRCIENLKTLKENTGFDVSGKTILEMGAGWHGIDQLVFYLMGCREAITIDHWPHLTYDAIARQISKICENSSQLDFGALSDPPTVSSRLDLLRDARDTTRTLRDLLRRLNIRYLISESGNPEHLEIAPRSIDLYYSFSVLQRISERALASAIRHVGHTLLRNGACFYVCTDQKDINSQEHVDTGLWVLHYLKFSDLVFSLMTSSKLNFQNRLRHSDFLRMLEGGGMHPSHVETVVSQDNIERLKSFPVARRFSRYPLEDMAIVQSTFMGLKNTLRE